MAHSRNGAVPLTPRRRSVLDYLIDTVNHTGDMPTELKEEGPEHLKARPVLDEDRKKRQKETEDDQQELYHPNTSRPPPESLIADSLTVSAILTVGISLLLLDRAPLPPFP
jgi:hypothetical protein